MLYQNSHLWGSVKVEDFGIKSPALRSSQSPSSCYGNFIYRISNLYHCCNEIPNKKQPKDRVVSGSQYKGTVYHGQVILKAEA